MSEDTELLPALAGQEDFAVVLRGYDRRQVDDFAARMRHRVQDLEGALARTEQDLARAEQDLDRARREVQEATERAARDRPTFEELGERVTEMLRLAEQEAAAQRATAASEVARLRQDAEEQARRTVAEAERQAAEIEAAAQRRVAELDAQHQEVVRRLGEIRDTLTRLLPPPPVDQAPDQAAEVAEAADQRVEQAAEAEQASEAAEAAEDEPPADPDAGEAAPGRG
ncbi:MAG: hypothetical protein ACOYY2_08345 [Actinomycetota bacterium]